MKNLSLPSLGFTPGDSQAAAAYAGLYPVRVSSQHKDLYRVIGETGEIHAVLSGKLSFGARTESDYPAVGDWVMVDRQEETGGYAVIHHILPRRTLVRRKAAGSAGQEQVIAANIDRLLICMALNHDFNLRRLERYLAVAWDSGAVPLVVLTKADLCDDLDDRLAAVRAVAIGVDILTVSSLLADGFAPLLTRLSPGETVALVGSSGVGKSTLINRFLGDDVLATAATGMQDKGRHTTTYRQLLLLPGGCLVIDTPGMRELQLDTADLSQTFADIAALADRCRFADCRHGEEPGCAVQAAIQTGELAAGRFASYQKLQTELAYQGLDFRKLEQEKLGRMMAGLGGIKQARRFAKEKNRRR